MPHTLRTFLESIDNRVMHIHDEVDPISQIGYLCSESRGPLMFHNLTAALRAQIAELTEAGVDWQVMMFGHAVHSFCDKGQDGDALRYDEKLCRQSYRMMRDFFAETL